MARGKEPTDEQYAVIAPLIRSRPWRDTCEMMNGVLWILRSGASWQDLPERFPPYQTCRRRFLQWVREGVLRKVRAEDLRTRGDLNLSECFIDGTFVVAKKGARSRKDQAR